MSPLSDEITDLQTELANLTAKLIRTQSLWLETARNDHQEVVRLNGELATHKRAFTAYVAGARDGVAIHVATARQAEREACAAIADDARMGDDLSTEPILWLKGYEQASLDISRRIRSRDNSPPPPEKHLLLPPTSD